MIANMPRWVLVGLGLVFLVGIPALAETFDIANGDVAGLIAAINAANGNGVPDTIDLAPGGTYTLSIIDNDDFGDANGLPTITSEITINGNGATIERDAAPGTLEFRIFDVMSTGTLVLNDVTIANGVAGMGGGISSSSGTLTLANCTVSGNTAGMDGGGIRSSSGTLTLTDCTVSGNTARMGGG